MTAAIATIGFFAIGDEAFVEGGKLAVPSCDAQGRHEQGASDLWSSTADFAVTLFLAAVVEVRCNAGQCGSLSARHGAEFGQDGQQLGRHDRAKAVHGGADGSALSKRVLLAIRSRMAASIAWI
jgi:hypothetical protein